MNLDLKITHFYHSGFSVACEDMLFIFDYWLGEEGELTEDRQLTEAILRQYRAVYVFISHEHMDHMDPIVFTWKDLGNISYIVSSDMPVGTRGRRMAPGDSLTLEDGITVTAFDSTDLGVSFLLDLHGIRLFHAGDLNFWHWREESTMREIEEAEEDFRKAVVPISRETVDIAFFPVDPRQGSMFDAGANYFILSVKPRLLIPMHYFHRADAAVEYARTASCRSTEVLAMPGYGDSILVSARDNGFMDISFPNEDSVQGTAEDSVTEDTAAPAPDDGLSPDNPFDESDLPVSLDEETGPEVSSQTPSEELFPTDPSDGTVHPDKKA